MSEQRAKLDKKLEGLTSKAVTLEERAKYAKKEADLRKRIAKAQRQIDATSPSSPVPTWKEMKGWFPKSGQGRFILAVIIVVAIFILSKTCK